MKSVLILFASFKLHDILSLWILSLGLLLLAVTVTSQPQECRYKCTTDYRPVCGVGRRGCCRTFTNDCFRLSFNCQNRCRYDFLKDGACDENCNTIFTIPEAA